MSIIAIGALAAFTVAVPLAPVQAETPPEVAIGADTSLNWAGYTATGGYYTGIGSTWVVPAPTDASATRVAADATWIGIGGVSSKDLLQAGTQAIIENGSITYQAWYETLPQGQTLIPLTVTGGDSVTVSLSETGTNTWQLIFANNTTGERYTTPIGYASSHSSAEWIEEMPAGQIGRRSADLLLPLDNFGSVSFTSGYAMANGNAQTLATLGARALTMITNGNQVLAVPSALASDGVSFSVTRSALAVNGTPGSWNGWRRNGIGVRRSAFGPWRVISVVPTGSAGERYEIRLQFSRFSR